MNKESLSLCICAFATCKALQLWEDIVVSVFHKYLCQSQVFNESVDPSLGVPGPGVGAGLSQEGVEEHRLPDRHIGGEVVVCLDVGHPVPQPAGGRGHLDAVDDQLASDLGPVVPRRGRNPRQDVAKRRPFHLWKNKQLQID